MDRLEAGVDTGKELDEMLTGCRAGVCRLEPIADQAGNGDHRRWSCPAFVDTSTLGQRVMQLGPNDTSSRIRPATAGR